MFMCLLWYIVSIVYVIASVKGEVVEYQILICGFIAYGIGVLHQIKGELNENS